MLYLFKVTFSFLRHSYQYHIIRTKPKWSLIVIRYHSMLFVITHCHSLSLLSFAATRCTTRCHSLSFVLPLIVTHCHSFSLSAIWCITHLSFYQRSSSLELSIFKKKVFLKKKKESFLRKSKFPFIFKDSIYLNCVMAKQFSRDWNSKKSPIYGMQQIWLCHAGSAGPKSATSDSSTCAFLWILQKFSVEVFWTISPGKCLSPFKTIIEILVIL